MFAQFVLTGYVHDACKAAVFFTILYNDDLDIVAFIIMD